MWIQLTTTQNIEIRGESRRFHPGDWVEVGKHLALSLLAAGAAIAPETAADSGLISSGAGIVAVGDYNQVAALAKNLGQISVQEADEPALLFDCNAVIQAGAPVFPAYIPLGLHLLERWEIAVPMADYNILACNLGSEAEREQTARVIRDLRVPTYDTRLIFARRTDDTRRLFELWNAEPTFHRGLAFLRALYIVKPLILALPNTWMSGSYAH